MKVLDILYFHHPNRWIISNLLLVGLSYFYLFVPRWVSLTRQEERNRPRKKRTEEGKHVLYSFFLLNHEIFFWLPPHSDIKYLTFLFSMSDSGSLFELQAIQQLVFMDALIGGMKLVFMK